MQEVRVSRCLVDNTFYVNIRLQNDRPRLVLAITAEVLCLLKGHARTLKGSRTTTSFSSRGCPQGNGFDDITCNVTISNSRIYSRFVVHPDSWRGRKRDN